MLQVHEVTDTQGFAALKDTWNSLAVEAGLSIFQSWQWAWHWWGANSRGKKLWLLVVKEGAKTVAVAPLFISSSYLGLPIRVVAFLGTGGTDYLNFIISPQRPEALGVLLKHLLLARSWDAIDLHQVPRGGAGSLEMLNDLAYSSDGGLCCDRLAQDPAFAVALPENWDAYLGSLSKKFRWNIQYYSRRLEREHKLRFRLSTPESAPADTDIFFKLHQKRFVDKKKPGAYMSPKFRKFHAALAKDLAEAGWLRLYIMEIDSRPVASLYGFSFGKGFYYFLGGFEPEWGAMSVSTVLIARAVQDAISNGLDTFDFLRGQEPYKRKWFAEESANHRLIISRAGKKAGLVQKMLSLENELTLRAKEKMQK